LAASVVGVPPTTPLTQSRFLMALSEARLLTTPGCTKPEPELELELEPELELELEPVPELELELEPELELELELDPPEQDDELTVMFVAAASVDLLVE
jgi:hypothetical protein